MKREKIRLDDLMPIIDLIEKGKDIEIVITGNSMFPLLHHNKDTVILQKPQKKLVVGDIVFCKRDNGKYILHRIVRIKGDQYYLAGDNQWIIEKGIFSINIKAVVKSLTRNNKVIDTKAFKYRLYSYFIINVIYLRTFIRLPIAFICRIGRKFK